MSDYADSPSSVRLGEAVFVAELTDKLQVDGTWRYAWVEQAHDPYTDSTLERDSNYKTATPGRTGSVGTNYANELNNQEVSLSPLYWIRLKGSVGQQQTYEIVGRVSGAPYQPAYTWPQWTTSQNNFTPTTAAVQRISSNATVSLTGAVVEDGGLRTWLNVGTHTIQVPNESASSTAANRWTIPGGGTIALQPGGTITTYKDATTQRNVVVSIDNGVPVVATGLDGGQAIYGGTATNDSLTLIPTSNTTPGTSSVVTQVTSADTTSTRTVLDVYNQTTATAAAGLGSTATFSLPNDSGAKKTVAAIDAVFTDATHASEDGSLVFRVAAAGTLAEAGRFVSPGIFRLPEESAPGTPASGFGYVYAGTDNKLHYVGDDGTDYDLTASGTPATSPPSTVTLTSVPQWFLAKSIAFSDAALNVAAATADVTAWTMPAKAWIGGVAIHTQAAAVGVTTLSTQVNWNGSNIGQQGNGKTLDDVQGQAFWSTSGTVVLGIASWTATQAVKVHFSSSGGNLNVLSAGQWDVYVLAANLG